MEKETSENHLNTSAWYNKMYRSVVCVFWSWGVLLHRKCKPTDWISPGFSNLNFVQVLTKWIQVNLHSYRSLLYDPLASLLLSSLHSAGGGRNLKSSEMYPPRCFPPLFQPCNHEDINHNFAHEYSSFAWVWIHVRALQLVSPVRHISNGICFSYSGPPR